MAAVVLRTRLKPLSDFLLTKLLAFCYCQQAVSKRTNRKISTQIDGFFLSMLNRRLSFRTFRPVRVTYRFGAVTMNNRNSSWALLIIAAFLLTSTVAARSDAIFDSYTLIGQNPSPWPTLEEQLEVDDVIRGSELEKLIRANQDFNLLRFDEAHDRLPYPPWLRVYWRKQHPEGIYSANDPSGGYPRTLNAIYDNLKATLNVAPRTTGAAQNAGSFPWPSLSQQISDAGVTPGSALESLIRANQDFSMLRPEEAKDTLRVPPWLRVYWRKQHSEGNYSASDPTGGYPLVLKEIYEWMVT